MIRQAEPESFNASKHWRTLVSRLAMPFLSMRRYVLCLPSFPPGCDPSVDSRRMCFPLCSSFVPVCPPNLLLDMNLVDVAHVYRTFQTRENSLVNGNKRDWYAYRLFLYGMWATLVCQTSKCGFEVLLRNPCRIVACLQMICSKWFSRLS